MKNDINVNESYYLMIESPSKPSGRMVNVFFEGGYFVPENWFWIGLAVGAVAGIFGYRFMQEREQQLAAAQSAQPTSELPLAELQRQREELDDMIAAQESQQK